MRVADGLEMLDISAVIMGSPNTIHPTLLWNEESAVLVDVGFPGQLPLIQKAVEQVGAPFEQLNTLIITHHDIDHIGSAASLKNERQGHLKVIAQEEEKAYIEGTKRPLKLAQMETNLSTLPENMRTLFQQLNTAFANCRVTVDQTVSDGEELPFCGGVIVISTPGHTLGHICLYHPGSRTLIAGDALEVENGVLGMAPPSINYNMNLCRKSLKKLANYEIETVICYHGGLFRGKINQRIRALAKGE